MGELDLQPAFARARPPPKISRIRPVRSSTLQFQACSRLRCCTGRQRDGRRSPASTGLCSIRAFELRDLARAEQASPVAIAGSGTSRLRRTSRSMAWARPSASSSRSLGEWTASLSRTAWPRRRLPALRARGGTGTSTIATRRVRYVAGRRLGVDRLRAAAACRSRRLSLLLKCPGLPSRRIGVHQVHGLPGHDGRDGVLVDQLRMAVTAQQHAEIVEPGDDALQLDAVDQEDGQWDLVLAYVIEERVLQALGPFGAFAAIVFSILVLGELP